MFAHASGLGLGDAMTLVDAALVVISILMCGYLLYALLKAEDF
jgi:K+-transporting ATPase KdpF subunit